MMVYSPEIIKKRMLEYANLANNEMVSIGMRGIIINKIEAALKLSDILPEKLPVSEKRKILFGWLFFSTEKTPNEVFCSPRSSKSLTGSEWTGLLNWVRPFKDDTTGKWEHRRQLKIETCWIFQRAHYYFDLYASRPLPLKDLEEMYSMPTFDKGIEIADGGIVETAIAYLGGTLDLSPIIVPPKKTLFELGFIPI